MLLELACLFVKEYV